MTGESVGSYLHQCRQQQGVALAALATRLCPLNVLAAIEQGQQSPSVAQLTQLYQQLRVERNQPLPQDYPIRRLPTFNRQLQSWWQKQAYEQLVANVAAGDVLHQLTTDTDRQAVLYYYGRSLAAIGDVEAAQLHLRAGLMFMTPQYPRVYRSLDLLLLAAENSVSGLTSADPDLSGFERAVTAIRQGRVRDAPENLTLVFYQYAQTLLNLNRPQAAIQSLREAIAWDKQQQTTYLLPDCYLLLTLALKMTQSERAAFFNLADQPE
ncbi:hypothetical protein [Levilactobacillus yiduensis]|uniref:hypothetical protein n=1 Tax=Levilactobacillus yiduensis TaxID=2953880 RepID=UPI000EF2CE81|nr:hypothetical protein [Levilactobacillus yiduensis]AYM01454.1 hypothetical protein D8911_00035 [Levilactobacillus brevis]